MDFLRYFPVLLCILFFLPTAGADSVKDSSTVVDGDGLIINELEHRLHGIDAMELDQGCKNENGKTWLCGQEAKNVLKRLVANKRVYCEWSKYDRYKRALSTCHVDDINLAAAMVYMGYAVAYRKYSEAYVAYEVASRREKNGIWNGTFDMPWDHRRAGKRIILPPPDKSRLIKGNINSKGIRFYHCPGDKSYNNTRITEAKGERWFSTDEEAELAGWTRPGNFDECRLP